MIQSLFEKFKKNNNFRSFDENGKKIYTLVHAPKPSHHKCRQDPFGDLVHEFSRRCYQKVEADPIRSVGEIYFEVRTELAANLSEDDKTLFFGSISSLKSIETGLYQFRENFRPKRPQDYVCIFFFRIRNSNFI